MTDIDDYYEDEGPAKEEPDCMTCMDAGCPDCGHVNPDDPEHLRGVATSILFARIPVVSRTVPDDEPWFTGLPAAAVATIRELVKTAAIETNICWHEPGTGWSNEQPF